MSTAPLSRRRSRRLSPGTLGWVAAGGIALLVLWNQYAHATAHEGLSRGAGLLYGLSWALESLAMLVPAFWASHRYPLGKGRWRRLPVHLIAALVQWLTTWVMATYRLEVILGTDGTGLFTGLPTMMFAYVLLAGTAHGHNSMQRYQAWKIERARLEAELVEAELHRESAELRALKSELNPRLLFGALANVRDLLRWDFGRANRLLVRLSELLREVLSRTGVQEVPLEDELRACELYLQVRCAGELPPDLRVDTGEEGHGAYVPHLLFQGLLEEMAHGGTLDVSARRLENRLDMRVGGEGWRLVGEELSVVNGQRARLEMLYPEGFSVDLLRNERGTFWALSLPWRNGPGAGTPVSNTRDLFGVAISEDPVPVLRRHRRVLGVWFLALFVLLVFSNYGPLPHSEHVAGWGEAFAKGTVVAICFTLTLALALVLARGWTLGRSRLPVSLLVHAVGAEIFVLLRLAMREGMNLFFKSSGHSALHNVASSLLVFPVFVGIAHGMEYASRLRHREREEVKLRAEIARARLQRSRSELRALKMELNPHFLFNALNSVSALMRRDPDGAERVLVRIEELLRRTIEGVETQQVPLEEELHLLNLYLEVEEVRFGDRLSVQWDIDPATLPAPVPHLVLQPLVENALKHGLSRRAAAGWIRISAVGSGSRLRLEVRDNGAGLTGECPGTGIGLSNVVARLEQLYGEEAYFDLCPAGDDEGGVLAVVELPWEAPVNLASFGMPEPAPAIVV